MTHARNSSIAGFLLATLAGLSCVSHAAMIIPNGPLYVGAAVAPTVMLDITKDQNLYLKAYNDYSDLDADGVVETTYKHTITYYGYFDSYKCYDYNTTNARFEPVASSYTETAGTPPVPNKPADCSGKWHGNFLNWTSMTRMDAVRKLLYGGYRSTDGAGGSGITVLERAFVSTDAHAWAKYYNPDIAKALDLTTTDATVLSARYPDISKLTPFNPTVTPTAVTSTTSNTVGIGAKTFAVSVSDTTKFSYGDQILIEDSTNSANYMIGAVSCVNATGIDMYNSIVASSNTCAAGQIKVVVEKAVSSVTKASWNIYNYTQTGITVCNATLGATSGANQKSQTNTNAPLMRVAQGNFSLWNANERWQCYWREEKDGTDTLGATTANGNRAALSGIYGSSIGPNKTSISDGRIKNGLGIYDYNVRVQACVTGAFGQESCVQYANGNYKPFGLLQYYGEAGLLKFGLMTGSYKKNKSGGVLRKNPGAMSDEINTTTDGTFKTTLPAGGTIVNTLNKMRIYGYNYNDGTYGVDGTDGATFCSWGQTTLTEGGCLGWGNPMSEVYLESLRYLAGQTANASFVTDDSTVISGLVTATWVDPISTANYCSPLNVLLFNASASSYDKDQMTLASDIGTNAVTMTDTLATEAGINGQSWYVGNNGTTNTDICSSKAVANLSSVYGICPEGAGTEGSYLMSGLAYYAHTNRIRSGTPFSVPTLDVKSLKVNHYGIALSSNVPKVTVAVGTGSATLLPAGRLNQSGSYGGGALVDFKIVCQIPAGTTDATLIAAVTKKSAGMCSAAGSGAFYVNWEDSEQGGDYDQDMWGRLKYQISGVNGTGTDITITSDVVSQSTPYLFGFGYAITGTNKDGPHFHSGINGFAFTDVTGVTTCGTCNYSDAATSYTYAVAQTATTNQVLNDPLWYVAKYGGFRDTDAIHKPDLVDKWDTKKQDGSTTGCVSPGCDGIPDNFFQVTNPNYLESALDKSFQSMLNESSASSVATNSTSLQTGSRIYQARFNSNTWFGELRAINLDPTTGAILADAWNAKDRINLQNYSTGRNIITYGLDIMDGIPFTWSAISGQTNTTQKDWLNKNEVGTPDANGSLRVNYLRGDDANEGKAAGKFRPRTDSKLGDIVNSSPVYVGTPTADWAGTTYSAFVAARKIIAEGGSRTPMIYAGGNDGMLHGFDATTGDEKIAYVPSVMYPNLSKLTGQSYAHKYFVDGTPMVNDVQISGAWKTYLVGGLNWGGRAYYALDITDTSIFTEANASTIVRWEFTNANDGDLGYTLIQPTYAPFKGSAQQIVKMHNGKWAVIVGNGYNSDSGKAALFIFFLDHTGSTWTAGTDFIKLVADATGPNNGLSTPTPYDFDNDGLVDYIYAGDLQGNVWKFNVTSATPASWSVAFSGVPLYVAKDASANRQPITTAVMVTPQTKAGTVGGAMVVFGTGKYLENSDTTSPYSVQSLYGVWDKTATSTIADRSSLVAQTVTGTVSVLNTTTNVTNNYRATSANTVDWTAKRGWYMDFPSSATTGERIAFNPLLRNDRIVASTLIPSATPCLSGGSSWLMELDAITGARLGETPFDANGDGTFNSLDYIIDPTDSTKKIPAGGISPGEGGIITTPTVIKSKDNPKKEYKYASSSTGAVIKTEESVGGAQTGRIAWRELNR
jgi:type IV pilus assembly protein PilY1